MSTRSRLSGRAGVKERERRAHVRCAIQTPVRIVLPDRESPVLAVGRDLSWGGMCLSVPTAFPALDRFQLILPWVHGRTLTATSQCVRVQATDAGHSEVAARFVSLSLRDHARLERLLTLLGRGESDETPPLARHLHVVVPDLAALDQALQEIAMGYYTLHSAEASALQQGVRFSLVSPDLPDIHLRARVIDVRAPTRSVPSKASANVFYTLILSFEHPQPLLRRFVDTQLEKLLCAQLTGTADRRRNVAPRFPHVVNPVDRHRAEKGWLEREFPDLLDRIAVCWGDSVAFGRLFRELILGDVGRPGGWSEAVWDDLTLLQAIHARVFT
ncbi:PilZ domain-containing protein [Thiocystis minor]|uniref:PilZ domain-containing protein n=1 Tax=Thiocystis minor TaxID=61597 RepID=UPI001913E0A3|nr:PilZ domain-containing protein [Thiocystis minor]